MPARRAPRAAATASAPCSASAASDRPLQTSRQTTSSVAGAPRALRFQEPSDAAAVVWFGAESGFSASAQIALGEGLVDAFTAERLEEARRSRVLVVAQHAGDHRRHGHDVDARALQDVAAVLRGDLGAGRRDVQQGHHIEAFGLGRQRRRHQAHIGRQATHQQVLLAGGANGLRECRVVPGVDDAGALDALLVLLGQQGLELGQQRPLGFALQAARQDHGHARRFGKARHHAHPHLQLIALGIVGEFARPADGADLMVDQDESGVVDLEAAMVVGWCHGTSLVSGQGLGRACAGGGRNAADEGGGSSCRGGDKTSPVGRSGHGVSRWGWNMGASLLMHRIQINVQKCEH
mmetsp:Transcript_50964/g.119537  ORF Transcript_50964/g.119537 Transcript_50964/m.119537 type:complete len:350 (+) Transcript_50964:1300-2349(+)